MDFDTFIMALAFLAALGLLAAAILLVPRLRLSEKERRDTVDTTKHEL